MAGPKSIWDATFTPSEAVAIHQLVKIDGDSSVAVSDTAGELVIGSALHAATADDVTNGRVIGVRVMGAARVIAGGAITAGARCQSAGNGTVTVAASGDAVAGIAIQAAASGDHFDMILTPGGGVLA